MKHIHAAILLFVCLVSSGFCQIIWTSRTAGTSVGIQSVSYGNNVYCAVAGGGTILTSPDGITWTSRTSGTTSSLNEITFGNNLFVAAGAAGTILTSSDGITWNSRTSGTTNVLYGIAYGNNTYVAAGGGTILTSPDCSTWTSRSSGTTNYNRAVDYCNNQFIALGDGGAMLTSPDGITWTSRTSGTSSILLGAAYGNNQYVVVGAGGTIRTSPDGITWTGRTSGITNYLEDVTYGNNYYVAVSNYGTIHTSTDGITWTDRASGTQQILYGVTFGNNLYVVVGNDGVIRTSPGIPEIPILVSPANGATNLTHTPVLMWGTVTNAASYRVRVSTNSALSTTVVDDSTLSASTKSITTPLNGLTTYYWCVNAKNSSGIGSWSAIWSFTTKPDFPTILDNDGNVYHTVTLGTQTWTMENLKTSTYNDGSALPLVTDGTAWANLTTPAYCWYNNDTAAYENTYGALYNWYAVNSGILAPPGWHVPTDADWNTLQNYLIANGYNWDTTTTVNKIAKSMAAQTNWSTYTTAGTIGNNLSANNSSDFSALPGGYRVYNGSFGYVGANGFWWSATENGERGANGPYLAYSLDYLVGANYFKTTGNSVRLVKDSTSLAAPVITAPANGATDVALAPTLAWGTVNNATGYRIQVSTVSTFRATVADDATLTAGTKTLTTALSSNTTYYWRVNAKNAGTTSAWSTGSFTTVFMGVVPLTSGWNLVSLNVAPMDSSATAVFGSMSHLVIAKNCAGQVYWPQFSINTIGTVHTGLGYQVYTTGADTINVAGAPVNVALSPIALDTGWNMMAYLPQTSMPITTVLAGILLQITIVKDNLGGIFWPDFGINTIGTMLAGQGYYIHMKSAAMLTCPAGSGKIRAPGSPGIAIPKTKHYVYSNGSTGRSAVVLLTHVLQNESAISDRSEIGAFDAAGTLVGSGVVMDGKAAFAVWGDNVMTKEKDGLVPLEPLSFKVWTPSGEENAADYSGSCSAGYADNAILQGTMTIHHTALITRSALSGVYPNPFKGNVRIGFDVAAENGKDMQNVEVTMFDVRGKLVCRLVKGMYTTGRYCVTWNGSNTIGSAMYIVRMKTGNFCQNITLFKVQ